MFDHDQLKKFTKQAQKWKKFWNNCTSYYRAQRDSYWTLVRAGRCFAVNGQFALEDGAKRRFKRERERVASTPFTPMDQFFHSNFWVVECLFSFQKLASALQSVMELQHSRLILMHFKKVRCLKNQSLHYQHSWVKLTCALKHVSG